HRRHPLRSLLAELDRLDRVRRIDLEPFDRLELTEALSDILGEAPSDRLVERLYARGEGNPLYTEELLAAGLDGRGAAPQSLREAMYDDLLPGERSELHLALARALEERGECEDDRGLELTSAVAHHYAVAGDQPAALRATVQAALAARDVHAYGDAADLVERALDLWPRV